MKKILFHSSLGLVRNKNQFNVSFYHLITNTLLGKPRVRVWVFFLFLSSSLPLSLLAGGHLPYGLYQVWKCVGDFISKWIQKRASTHSEMTVKWFY